MPFSTTTTVNRMFIGYQSWGLGVQFGVSPQPHFQSFFELTGVLPFLITIAARVLGLVQSSGPVPTFHILEISSD